jgi:Polysaccharide biosynthesis
MTIIDIVRGAHDTTMQISPAQIEVIGSAVLARSPGCRLLVFGVGRDAALWLALNSAGETLFVEDQPAYATGAPRGARIEMVDFAAHASVGSSLTLDVRALDALPPPASLRHAPFDVILVDGPAGFHMEDPGRAVSIRWASRLMRRETHVFIDDYNRAVERHFADLLIRHDNPPCVEIAHEREAGKVMLWRIGRSITR